MIDVSGFRNEFDAASLLLQQEGAHLDEHNWDEWLGLYCEDCEFWLPTWLDEETAGDDPQAQISHIYYPNRSGLEDRIVRIRSAKSPASNPLPRTVHLINGILPIAPPESGAMRVRSSWVTQVYFPRTKLLQAFIGRSEFDLALRNGRWLIRKKRALLLNDQIPTMLDFYFV